jgi:choline dehydrogenase
LVGSIASPVMSAPSESWDYIIVGAGAAGCVLANRLSASGAFRVLLLEAGGSDDHLWIRIPAGFSKTIYDPRLNWGYDNAPSPHTGGRSIPCPRGRVVGGSSSINGHLLVRGQALDYADWVALGATGWGWDEVLPYFRRSELRAGGDPQVRGGDGPLHITDPRLQHPLCDAFISAMGQLGLARNPDYNGGDQEGAGMYQYLMRDGRRWSAADAYLRPALARPNLQLRRDASVLSIDFDGRRATGVRYLARGQRLAAQARREVILAAGSIGSPQLLQCSGVGDQNLLQRLAIRVVAARPAVGVNLIDHYAARCAVRVRDCGTLNERAHGMRVLLEGLKYLVGVPSLLNCAPAHAFGFLRSKPELTRPDVQLLFAPASYAGGQVGRTELERLPGMTCGVSQLRPYSRGYVRIRGGNPLLAPEIQPNYLADERDLACFVAGLHFVRRLFTQPALARYVAYESFPGSACDSDDALREHVRQTGSTVFHPVGTCRMGSDADAVVDPQLRVREVEALRVIDASVMPSMVSGNTYATTIMIAERGADFVLDRAAKAAP